MAKENKDTPAGKKKASIVSTLLVPLVVLAAVGAAGGYGIGKFALAPNMAVPATGVETTPATDPSGGHAATDEASHESGADAPDGHAAGGSSSIVALDPIVVNLAAPAEVWLRMELALRTAAPLDDTKRAEIHQDLMSYARLLRLDQIRSPSGYLRVRADLLSRARTRAGQADINDLYVKQMLFE